MTGMRTMASMIGAVTLAVAVAITARPVGAEELRVAGGPVPIDDVLKPVKEHFEKETGITLSIIRITRAKELAGLVSGRFHMVVTSLPFENMFRDMEKEGMAVPDKVSYRKTVLLHTPVLVLLNPANPVVKLSKDQLKGLLTGKITNWKNAGGTDTPVTVSVAKGSAPIVRAVRHQVMDGENFVADHHGAGSSEEAREAVARTPGGITFAPPAFADGTVKAAQIPDIGGEVLAITKGAPTTAAQKLIDYIRGEGRRFTKTP